MQKLSGDFAERFNGCKRLLEASEKEICIVLAQLDPDAMGSAVLFKKIASHFGRKVLIRYAGPVDHPQNECIVNIFELDKEFSPFDGVPEGAESALLDSAMVKDSRLGTRTLKPNYIVDHHMTLAETDDKAWQFVESFGSCCTILTLMCQHFGIQFDNSDPTATLGAIGIYSDTHFLLSSQTKEEDIAAFNFLMKYGDWDALRRVHMFEFPIEYYQTQRDILSNMKTVKTFLVSCAGYLKEEQGVFLAIIADELIRCQGVSTVIIWGVIGDFLIVKVRSSDGNLRLDKFLKTEFGQTCAGARFGAGGAKVSLGYLKPRKKNKECLLQTLDETLMESLFDVDSDHSKSRNGNGAVPA